MFTSGRITNSRPGAGTEHVAASYSRFSSSMQRDESLEQQQERCRNAALEHGFQIDPTLEFSDAATSGTKRDREGLNALLKAAENGEFSTLYLYSLSRLAR